MHFLKLNTDSAQTFVFDQKKTGYIILDESKVPEHVKLFIYNFIDSVEILEILLYLRMNSDDWTTAERINSELKTQTASIAKRLLVLKSFGLVAENATNPGHFKYAPPTEEILETISLLSEEYKIRRYRIYELIFSQKKHIKNFADAFKFTNTKIRKDDENG